MYTVVFRYVKRGKFHVRTDPVFYVWYGVWWDARDAAVG
jgi:hypothetical protein